ncbi:PilZ domain-containing protein [Sphingomonas nostoxanthinifaciens]|uniref:PilZ domain-containing protein n=1 Tax=Sphingomonas nostoxanthinifaciens TaxID=2872652 RepID=UPI001CC21A40|nr:PilZ domain-containing protein [Sphingomonas nostoxanthinifaciens]UAK23491.1 PilZ domain-containing protein [Sphingomonas nostoxanthinifaciens]
MNKASGKNEARRAERREANAASTLRTEGAAPLDVVVLDLSATGLRIVTNADLAIGQEVSIGLAGAGATRAFVAWRRDSQYGCAFTQPLSAEDEARAFSNSTPIALGRPAAPAAATPNGAESLEDLVRQHRHWAIPGDALFGILAYIVAAVLAVRMLLG